MQELMSLQEIHEFGLQVLTERLKIENFQITEIFKELNSEISILAEREGVRQGILAAASMFPNNATIRDKNKQALFNYCYENGYSPCFAPIGLANAIAQNDEEMSLPLKGSQFYVKFSGLEFL